MNTDIWFRSTLQLSEIAEFLKLTDLESDAEDAWEWVIGGFDNVRIDLTRDYRFPRAATDVRVFRLDNDEIKDELLNMLVSALPNVALGPVNVGRWEYTREGFLRHLAYEITSDVVT